MARLKIHSERHATGRVGWLRAAVLGANDGIVSTASLVIGVSAAAGGQSQALIAGVAGLVAGAMSMAAGEYVSVSSQADSEAADLDRERSELSKLPKEELEELTGLYLARGLDQHLARQVAEALTEHDALAAHARDELGIYEHTVARPIQAAVTSALTFSAGAVVPVLCLLLPLRNLTPIVVAIVSVALLALLGALSARLGGARVGRAVARVTFWGVLAMAITAAIGRVFGAAF